jgi:hypothetical protein
MTSPIEHDWVIGRETRRCNRCGEREMYWDDEEYPDNQCLQTPIERADEFFQKLGELSKEYRISIAGFDSGEPGGFLSVYDEDTNDVLYTDISYEDGTYYVS